MTFKLNTHLKKTPEKFPLCRVQMYVNKIKSIVCVHNFKKIRNPIIYVKESHDDPTKNVHFHFRADNM